MYPDISVCITTFNHESYIEECVQSVLSQEGAFELEVLIGDDCSADDTRRILSDLEKRYPNKIKLYLHKSQLGAGDNLKTLIEASRGKYIAQLDGDDYWLQGKLQKQLSAMEKNPRASAVYTNALIKDRRNLIVGVFNDAGDRTISLGQLIKRGNFLNNSSMVFRSEYKSKLREFSGDFIDFRLHVNLACKGELIHLGEPLVVYRWLVAGGMTHTHKEKIGVLTLDAFEDARRFGVDEFSVKKGLTRLFRVTLYDSLVTLDFARISRFQVEIQKRRRLTSKAGLFGMYINSALKVPLIGIKLLLRKFGSRKVFFPVR